MAKKTGGSTSKMTITESDLSGQCPRLNKRLELIEGQIGEAVSTAIAASTQQKAKSSVSPVITASTGTLTLVLTSNSGMVGQAFAGALAAKGGLPDYTFSIATGADCLPGATDTLPDGLSLNTATGAITGTPTTVQAKTFTGKVVDSGGGVVKIARTITIIPASGTGSLPVPGTVTAATIAETGVRTIDQSQETSTTLSVTPTISGGFGQQFLTVYLSHDGGSLFSAWGGVTPYILGTTVHVDLDYLIFTVAECGGLTSNNIQAYVIDAQLPTSPNPVLLADLPAGGVLTNKITVLLAPPLSTGVTAGLANVAGDAATLLNIYMGLNSANDPYAEVIVTVNTPGQGDANCWAYSISVTWTDAFGVQGNPGGVDNPPGEREFEEFVNDGLPHSKALLIHYPTQGSPYRYLRFKLYGFNRNVSVSPPYSDVSGNVTLIGCWGFAGATFASLQIVLPTVFSITAGDASALPNTDPKYSPRTVDVTRGVHARIWITPVVAVLPVVVQYFVNQGDGRGWNPWSTDLIIGLGQVSYLPGDAWIGSTNQSWQIAAQIGVYGGNEQFIPSLPSGACAPASFTLTGTALPLSTDVNSIVVATGAGGSYPYNGVTADKAQFFSIPQITIDTSVAFLDPNAFYMRITAQDYDAGDNPIGPEQPFDGCLVDGAVHDFGPLMGSYGTQGGSYTRANPFPAGAAANICSVKLRVYICNSTNQTATSFADPACATLQPSATRSVTVASAGTVPPGVMDAGRISSGFGPGVHKFGGLWQVNYGNGTYDPGDGTVAAHLDTPLSIVLGKITIINADAAALMIAAQTAGYTILKNQSVTSLAMAANAVTYANAALAALSVIDSNMFSVSINKVTYGTSVFAGPVVLARGSGLPMVYLNNDAIGLFSAASTSGSSGVPGLTSPSYGAAGLTSFPYVIISSGSIALYSGTNASAIISPSALTFYSVSGNGSFPYLNITTSIIQIVSGNFSTSISASQIQMVYTGGPSATLNSSQLVLAYSSGVSLTLNSGGMKVVNGTYSIILQAGLIQLWSVDGNSSFPCIGITTSGITILQGSITQTLSNVTATLGVSFASGPSTFIGLNISNSSTGEQHILWPSGCWFMYGGNSVVSIGQSGGVGTISVFNGSIFGASASLTTSFGTPKLTMGTGGVSQQVVTSRKSGPGAPGGFADVFAQAWCYSLFTALSASTGGHGLIA